MTNSLTESVVSRCPACEQPIEDRTPEQCPHCGYDFGVDRAATSDDTTPFAEAYAQERTAHRRMWNWVWTAPAGRLKHLALMRSSAASKSFARRYWLLLAVCMGLLLAVHFGWRAVSASPGIEVTGSVMPHGRGWLHVAAMPNPYRVTAAPATPVDLWWNAPQMVIAGVTGFLSGLLLLWVIFVAIQIGVHAAHRAPYRGERRMTAALHYSTAWSVPALFAVTIWLLIPLGRIGMISKWGWPPARSSLEFLAGLVGTITFVCWWFWLLRLGSAAPADTRTRVAWFFGLGAPVMVAGGAAAWWFGLGYGLTHLFDSWKLGF